MSNERQQQTFHPIIWSQDQHPYKHTLGDFTYNNPATTTTSLEGALDWIFAALYPKTQAQVANVAALPAAGNTLLDQRVVTDDGDGKAATYRWEQREGDVAAKWYKIYDMDWGEASILSNFLNKTQDVYVFKYGLDDLDDTGTAIAGTYAGQTIFGGNSANTNLTLAANSGDGVGADTGYVQVDDNFKPTANGTLDVGTATEKFKDGYFSGTFNINTMVITGGSITDSSGAISFGNENLSTTGTFGSNVITVTKNAKTIILDPDNGTQAEISSSTGIISFINENLITTGNITGTSGFLTSSLEVGPLLGNALIMSPGSITDESGAISFGNENLSTSGTMGAGDTTVTQLNADNITLDLNTISITNLNGDLNIGANGTGVVNVTSAMTTIGQTVTGTLAVTGILNADNLRIDGNTLSSQDANGNIILAPNGVGLVQFGSGVFPTTTSVSDLGKTANVWNDLWIDGNFQDDTNTFVVSEFMKLRNIMFRDAARTLAVQNGDSLFYDSTSGTWLASHPDTEILHSELGGLTTGDSGHTQFAMLTGRAGGQAIQGGTAASESLTLESTSHATKGSIFFSDNLAPVTNANFTVSWQGTDLGDGTHYIRDVYTKGQFFGLRLENYTSGTIPGFSANNVGRLIYTTDTKKVYVDDGTQFRVVGVGKHLEDLVYDGLTSVKNVDVSANIQDARNCIIQFLDNSNNFDRIYCQIEATSATNVRITTGYNLPAASYRLIVME